MSQEGKIVVKNLSKKTTNGFLEKFFGSYGKICNIQIFATENDIFAEVIFEDKRAAVDACNKCNGKMLQDSQVTIQLISEDKSGVISQPAPSNPSLLGRYAPLQTNQNIENRQTQANQDKFSDRNFINTEKKELLGEIIYPIAKSLHSKYAPKLTGMLLDAIEKLESDEQIKHIIGSKKNLVDLIEASYEQLNKANLS